jgi:HlyD family secretion protein
MKRIAKWSTIPLLAAVAIVAGTSIGGGSKAPAAAYDTAVVDRGRIVARVTATGVLSPLKTVQVGSQVSGRISELLVDFNSPVTRGQVIARLDPQLFTAAVERAKANLSAARADLTRARALAADAARQAERAALLEKKGVLPAAEADTARSTATAQKAQVTAATASVEQATAAVREAELELANATIYSPIDGVVISRSVDVGQTVAASLQAPVLFTIAEDLAKMQVNTSVAESDVGRLAAGQPVSFSVDAFPEKTFRGKVRQIRNAPTTVQNVVTYDAVIDVENPELLLKPGMTANVTFIVGQVESALRVPNGALRFRPADAAPQTSGRRGAAATRTLYKLDAGELVAVEVKPGLTDGARTAIVEGLTEGDVIVTGAPGAEGAAARPAGSGGGGRRMRGPF